MATPHHVDCQASFENQCAQDGDCIFHELLRRWEDILCFLDKLARWGRICVQLCWYLGFSLEREQCKIWEIPSWGFTSLLTIKNDVSRLGQQSSPLGLVTIHQCEPSQQAWIAHQGQFICFDTINGLVKLLIIMTDINKWISIVNVYLIFHKCQTVPC